MLQKRASGTKREHC